MHKPRVVIHDPILFHGGTPWKNRTGVLIKDMGYGAMIKLDNDNNKPAIFFLRSEFRPVDTAKILR